MQFIKDMKARRSVLATLGGLALALSGCATVPAAGSMASEQAVRLTTPDGAADGWLFIPAEAEAPAVILWGDLGGLRPVVLDLGRKLAAQGFVVLVPNEFYRSVTLDGSAASSLEFATRNKEWRGTANDDAVLADARAYLAYLEGLPRVDHSAKVGAVGYEIGAVHAFLTARAAPDKVGAVAAIQPLAIATARPNSPHLFVKGTQAAYYVAIGSDADAREPDDKTDLAKAFADAGLKGEVVVMPGKHGFALADNANSDAASAARAWDATVALLKANLK